MTQKMIWTPPRASVRLHNHFHIELRDARSRSLVREAEAYNVVTNEGRKALARNGTLYTSAMNFMAGVVVGSGTSAPAPTDATLAQQRSYAETATSAQVGSYTQYMADEANQVWWMRRKYQFAETVANYTLGEVGLYNAYNPNGQSANNSSPYTVYTRALFRDANGNPITITKTGSQIMTITATVYLTRGTADTNMVLLDKWFTNQVKGTSNQYVGIRLGDGTATPSRSDTTLSGTEVAAKYGSSGASFTINRRWWDGTAWTTTRPAGKDYVTSYSIDWDLAEGNVTFSELLWYQMVSYGSSNATTDNVLLHMVFPCGNVTQSSYTKTNQVKLRQYFELAWG